MSLEIADKSRAPAPHLAGADHADAAGFRRLVEARRAVRVYDGTAVPDAVMHDILDLALLAPSSSNLQPAEFHWVRDPAKKARLVEACLDQPSAKTAAELVVVVARTGTWSGHAKAILAGFEGDPKVPQSAKDYYQKLVPFAMTLGPASVVGAVKRLILGVRRLFRATPQPPVSRGDLRVWAHTSTALAAQNVMLGARAHGFDSCPMGGFDPVRVARLLRLPADAEVQMVISVGKRAPEGVYAPRSRLDRGAFIKVV